MHHSLGAHALCVGGWARALLEATTADEGAGDETFYDDSQADLTLSRPSGRALAIRRVLHRRKPSQVVWAVKTPAPQPGASPAVRPICGLVITSDVYLSYALLAIAAPSIPVALELNMRVFDTPSEPEPLGLALGSDKPRSGYTSLLGDGPAFEVPTPFKALSSLPVAPKAVARGGAELQVTPETLRELGSTASRMREQMRVVVGAGNAVQARLDLQMREMARMLDKLAEVRRRTRAVARGGPSGGEAMQRRLEEALRRQGEIVARTDRVLQRLMDAHQPVLSVYERKWFAELERLAKEVGVSAEQGKPLTGLVAHADKVRVSCSARPHSSDSRLIFTRFTHHSWTINCRTSSPRCAPSPRRKRKRRLKHRPSQWAPSNWPPWSSCSPRRRACSTMPKPRLSSSQRALQRRRAGTAEQRALPVSFEKQQIALQQEGKVM